MNQQALNQVTVTLPLPLLQHVIACLGDAVYFTKPFSEVAGVVGHLQAAGDQAIAEQLIQAPQAEPKGPQGLASPGRHNP